MNFFIFFGKGYAYCTGIVYCTMPLIYHRNIPDSWQLKAQRGHVLRASHYLKLTLPISVWLNGRVLFCMAKVPVRNLEGPCVFHHLCTFFDLFAHLWCGFCLDATPSPMCFFLGVLWVHLIEGKTYFYSLITAPASRGLLPCQDTSHPHVFWPQRQKLVLGIAHAASNNHGQSVNSKFSAKDRPVNLAC